MKNSKFGAFKNLGLPTFLKIGIAGSALFFGAMLTTPLVSLSLSDNNTKIDSRASVNDIVDAQGHVLTGILNGIINGLKSNEGIEGIKERINPGLTIEEVNHFKRTLIEKEKFVDVEVSINTFDRSVNRYRYKSGVIEENRININPLQGNRTEIGGKKELLDIIAHEISHSVFAKYKNELYIMFTPFDDEKMNISLNAIMKDYKTYDKLFNEVFSDTYASIIMIRHGESDLYKFKSQDQIREYIAQQMEERKDSAHSLLADHSHDSSYSLEILINEDFDKIKKLSSEDALSLAFKLASIGTLKKLEISSSTIIERVALEVEKINTFFTNLTPEEIEKSRSVNYGLSLDGKKITLSKGGISREAIDSLRNIATYQTTINYENFASYKQEARPINEALNSAFAIRKKATESSNPKNGLKI